MGQYSGRPFYMDVSAIFDYGKDGEVDAVRPIFSGETIPNGITVWEGTVFIAEVDKVWSCPEAADQLMASEDSRLTQCDQIYTLPNSAEHGWRYLKVNPNTGDLCVAIGYPCNTCESESPFGEIICFQRDGSNPETLVTGMRNSVGFDW